MGLEEGSRQRAWHVQGPWGEEKGGPTARLKATGWGWDPEAGDKNQSGSRGV